MPYICDAMVRQTRGRSCSRSDTGYGTLRPLLLLSPIIAETIAKPGLVARLDVKRYLFEHARMPAYQFERHPARLDAEADLEPEGGARDAGRIPKVFHESDDPNRMVPLVWKPEDFLVTVTGDLSRNSVYIFAHNGVLGFPTAKRIRLPKDWKSRIKN